MFVNHWGRGKVVLLWGLRNEVWHKTGRGFLPTRVVLLERYQTARSLQVGSVSGEQKHWWLWEPSKARHSILAPLMAGTSSHGNRKAPSQFFFSGHRPDQNKPNLERRKMANSSYEDVFLRTYERAPRKSRKYKRSRRPLQQGVGDTAGRGRVSSWKVPLVTVRCSEVSHP